MATKIIHIQYDPRSSSPISKGHCIDHLESKMAIAHSHYVLLYHISPYEKATELGSGDRHRHLLPFLPPYFFSPLPPVRSNVAPVVVARIRSLPCVAATAAVAAAWLYGPGGGRFKGELVTGRNCMSQVLNLDFQQTSLGDIFFGGVQGMKRHSQSVIFSPKLHMST